MKWLRTVYLGRICPGSSETLYSSKYPRHARRAVTRSIYNQPRAVTFARKTHILRIYPILSTCSNFKLNVPSQKTIAYRTSEWNKIVWTAISIHYCKCFQAPARSVYQMRWSCFKGSTMDARVLARGLLPFMAIRCVLAPENVKIACCYVLGMLEF